MINRDELKTVTGAIAGADQTLGSAIPQNMRRFIYRVRFINLGVGVNQLLIGKRENAAGATTNIDTLESNVAGEMITDPDELHDDSAPLYVVDGPPGNVPVAVGFNSLVRVATSAAAGIATYWYVDEPC
ncbi:MAG: hypothetical protein KKB38_20905 [Gammaproteobacteria bacterium]|nr:hypothetical protein [Gammaproteobacteria bacterium]